MEIPFSPEGFGSDPDGLRRSSGDNVEENQPWRINEGLSSHGSCSTRVVRFLKQRLPILEWLPKYRGPQLMADSIAGSTVGLTVIPQSMAYAAIAGLPPQYGLYSSYVGVILYMFLGSCRQVTVGPTAVMGLLTFETCGANFPQCAILTGFYSGVFELLMAIMHLGWVVSFISEPVAIGFTAGAAATIISSQIKNFLGLKGPKGNGFIGCWIETVRAIQTISFGDTVVGLCSLIALLALKKLNDLKLPEEKRLLKRTLWLISLSRNAIIVLITSIIAYSWVGNIPFQLTGPVVGGFPPISLPNFNLPYNATAPTKDTLTFLETWQVLGAGPLVVALISVLQNIAIAKTFGSGQKVDATQEMFALGMSNVVGSLFSSIPVSGSFSRSAVNQASGVQSPLGGLFTGVLVLLALSLLTPSFYYIPKASLAAVIICAVVFMIESRALKTMWSINKMDCISCIVTFISSILLGMEYGIMIGVGISLSVLLLRTLKPSLNPELRNDLTTGINFVYTKPDSGITFPSVDYVRDSISKIAQQFPDANVLVISFEKWTTLDYTSVIALSTLVKAWDHKGKTLIFVDCGQHWIEAFQSAGIKFDDIPHCDYMELSAYLNTRRNLTTSPSLPGASQKCVSPEKSPLKSNRSPHNCGDYGAVGTMVDTQEGHMPLLGMDKRKDSEQV